jgi:hypothetical protein
LSTSKFDELLDASLPVIALAKKLGLVVTPDT